MRWNSFHPPKHPFRGIADRAVSGFAFKAFATGMLMSLLGCATSPGVQQTTPVKPVAAPETASPPVVVAAPAPATVAVPPVRTVPSPAPVPQPPPAAQPAELVPDGEVSVLVESEPHGATIVVNGVPVGKAPQRVLLPITPQGFVRDTVSIKARFVAESISQQSSTIAFELTPLDRMPSGLVFTPEKVVRKR